MWDCSLPKKLFPKRSHSSHVVIDNIRNSFLRWKLRRKVNQQCPPFQYLHPSFSAHLRNPHSRLGNDPESAAVENEGWREFNPLKGTYYRLPGYITKKKLPSHYHYIGRSEVCYPQCCPGIYIQGYPKRKGPHYLAQQLQSCLQSLCQFQMQNLVPP
jgi:hypothetical protein